MQKIFLKNINIITFTQPPFWNILCLQHYFAIAKASKFNSEKSMKEVLYLRNMYIACTSIGILGLLWGTKVKV